MSKRLYHSTMVKMIKIRKVVNFICHKEMQIKTTIKYCFKTLD